MNVIAVIAWIDVAAIAVLIVASAGATSALWMIAFAIAAVLFALSLACCAYHLWSDGEGAL